VTPEITLPLNSTDTQPNVYMPKDFLVKLSPSDVVQPNSKSSKK